MAKVLCLANNKVYKNIWVASVELDCNPEYIYRVCQGKYKSTKGMVFVYLDEYEKMTDEQKQALIDYKLKKTLVCDELNKEFHSFKEAVDYCQSLGVKIFKGHISECVNGLRKHHGIYNGIRLSWRKKE